MDFALTRNAKVLAPSQRDIDLLRASPLFDPDWYRRTYADVVLSGLTAAQHFLAVGGVLLRDPSPAFSSALYLMDNPDVAQAGMNPLVHYLRYGRREGRRAMSAGPQATQTKFASVGPAPWIKDFRHGAFLDAVVASNGTDPLPMTEDQRTLARAALAGAVPRISVIMPTWNREAAVRQALDSAFGQSLPLAELILVDDGSEDATLSVVRAHYAAQIAEGLLKIIEAPHGGVSAARNAGLAAATGDLVAYLDSDNRWQPDYLLAMAAVFAESDTVSTAYCGLSMNDLENGTFEYRGRPWDRQRLVGVNYIDLNVFMHRRALYDQYGGFDTKLSRLVDWDLIARYTQLYEPVYLPVVGVDYFLDGRNLQNITRTVPLADNKNAVIHKMRTERLRRGLDDLRLAYVLWDWPALSQTFVLAEIRWLVAQGYDVQVYYKVAPDRAAALDFKVAAHQVDSAKQLADLLRAHQRNQIHAHFAYPCATNLAWPAAQISGIPFTFFAHAVDIFHENNVKRNRVGEMVSDPLCQRIYVHGDYHRKFLEPLGVPTEKIAYNFQAVDLADFDMDAPLRPVPANRQGRPLRGMFIGRFVEKKGLAVLLQAAAKMGPQNVQFDIYGYGPIEADIRQQAETLGLTNVTFHGPLDKREAVADAMRRSDFLAVPSVVAANGDTEGFPTVILEAMAMGVPVVTSDVSSIPNFLDDGINAIVTRQGNADSLISGIASLATMSEGQVAAMLRRARDFLKQRLGTGQTMRTYLDTWLDARIEIMLVTYDTETYRDIDHTREIIERLRKHTTTPYTLTVVDNGSDAPFVQMLRAFARDMPQMRLIELQANRFCGGASNIALAMSDAAYAIYVCSKEGFVQQHGWERNLLKAMRDDVTADMGGYLCHMPKYTLGSELQEHPAFDKFRKQTFAATHPDKPFRHIQGGVFILRRDAVLQEDAAFPKALPQGNMDVEFSYFLEATQRRMLPLEGVASLTVKTRPELSAVLDEKTVIAHPLTRESAAALSANMARPDANHCNICDAWHEIDANGICGACGSTGLARKSYQRLAHDWRGFRGGRAMVIGDEAALTKVLGARMFDVKPDSGQSDLALIVATTPIPPEQLRGLAARLARGGLMVFPTEDHSEIAILTQDPDFVLSQSDRCSRLLRSDWRPLQEVVRR